MKEDVLEQIAEDYLQQLGFFTMHNLPFRPVPEKEPKYLAREHSVASDIDILGINPQRRSPGRVQAICCKSWQAGFNPETWVTKIDSGGKMYGRDAWRSFRELCKPEWNRAFRRTVRDLTGQTSFTYVVCVTRLSGVASTPKLAQECWESSSLIRQNLGKDIRLQFLDLATIWDEISTRSGPSKRPASSEIGRLAQLLDAAGIGSNGEQSSGT